MADMRDPILGYFPDAELVIAMVYPLGTERIGVEATLNDYLGQFGYEINPIRLTRAFPELLKRLGQEWHPPAGPADLAHYKIDAGNLIRELTESKDILARVAAGLIHTGRPGEPNNKGRKANATSWAGHCHGRRI